ncbi:DUF4112 domain-containing protein [Hyphomicrobium sp. 99]|uniref:DUF4112 domain-containing protein n=1 Tax=Hyphomicrobium sp. 99 TaxID=1163419 RepID=UPI001FD97611|nr:DUF4112 domain-containing protein [Hyphomicrobium sp. 99]
MSTMFERLNGTRFGDAFAGSLPAGEFDESFARIEALAKMLDSAIRIPGTSVVMGIDAVLGLVPIIGDAISGAMASYIIWEARRLGAPRWLIARMAMNTALDTAVGSIPVFGDMFDVAYKSNLKNVALLKRHAEKHGARYGRRTIETTYTVG